MVKALLDTEDSVEEPAVVVYLLGDILNDFNLTEEKDQEQFIQVHYPEHYVPTTCTHCN